MSGRSIRLVQTAAEKYITRYNEMKKSTKNLVAILFNDNAEVIEQPTIGQFLEKFNQSCYASGRTNFSEPLKQITAYAKSKYMKELHVHFLTDGEDDCAPEDTEEAALELKQVLND